MVKTKGISFQIIIGQWCRPHLRTGKTVYGFALGWLSVNIVNLDVESLVCNTLEDSKKLKSQVIDLKIDLTSMNDELVQLSKSWNDLNNKIKSKKK